MAGFPPAILSFLLVPKRESWMKRKEGAGSGRNRRIGVWGGIGGSAGKRVGGKTAKTMKIKRRKGGKNEEPPVGYLPARRVSTSPPALAILTIVGNQPYDRAVERRAWFKDRGLTEIVSSPFIEFPTIDDICT